MKAKRIDRLNQAMNPRPQLTDQEKAFLAGKGLTPEMVIRNKGLVTRDATANEDRTIKSILDKLLPANKGTHVNINRTIIKKESDETEA